MDIDAGTGVMNKGNAPPAQANVGRGADAERLRS